MSTDYETLEEAMERDFEELDDDDYETFKENIQAWAGEHYSPAVDVVSDVVYKELHRPSDEEEPEEPPEKEKEEEEKEEPPEKGLFGRVRDFLLGFLLGRGTR